ncbi:MAG: hypothetical protein K2J83_05620 [Clostridia bacterium]|nr:hypothetical protein [Clostridia bacterium]
MIFRNCAFKPFYLAVVAFGLYQQVGFGGKHIYKFVGQNAVRVLLRSVAR